MSRNWEQVLIIVGCNLIMGLIMIFVTRYDRKKDKERYKKFKKEMEYMRKK